MMQKFQVSETTAAYRRLFFQAVDATDGLSPETGLTGTGWVSENGATPAASPSITEISAANMPGRYYVELLDTDLSTLGIVEFRYKDAACAEVIARGQVVPWDPYDAVRQGMTSLPNAAAEAAGGLFTRGTGAGQINQQANGQIDANIERVRNAVLNALQSGRMDSYAGAMVAALITATEAPNLDAAISTRSSHGDPDPSNYLDVAISSRSSHGDPDPSGFLDVSVASRALASVCSEARLAELDGAALPADVAAVQATADAVEADTQDIQGRLPATLVGGAIDADVSALQAGVITATEAPNLDAAITTRATPAQVNTEVLDVVNVDTVTLPGQEAPPLAPTMRQMEAWLYKMMRNQKDMTNILFQLYADNGTTVDATAAASESGGTTTLEEMIAGT